MLLRAALVAILAAVTALAWLRWDAGQPRDRWFTERHGRLESTSVERSEAGESQAAASVRLTSDSGLNVSLRMIRDAAAEQPVPVLLVLGGHRTGSAAVELFGEVGERAVVALDYPYHGPQSVDGLIETTQAIPLIRKAFLDTPPAVSLAIDWLEDQPWVDRTRIVMVGASLGVPFAATAAARDDRLAGLLLVHGAADNRLWLQKNLSVGFDFLQPAMATLLHWLAYGPVFRTEDHVAAVSPRPVLIVGAREDERTPSGQTEVLFDAAREPKMLRWTDGRHLDPARGDIIDDLLEIVEEELSFFGLEEDGALKTSAIALPPG